MNKSNSHQKLTGSFANRKIGGQSDSKRVQFFNKKGVDYAALMVIVVIIAVGALYVQITKKTNMEREIGEIQAPILALNSETVLYEMYVREAAKLAATCDEQELNTELNKYLEIYETKKGWKIPKNNFVISTSEGKLTGVSLLPTEIPIKVKEKEIGKALFRPGFEITLNCQT